MEEKVINPEVTEDQVTESNRLVAILNDLDKFFEVPGAVMDKATATGYVEHTFIEGMAFQSEFTDITIKEMIDDGRLIPVCREEGYFVINEYHGNIMFLGEDGIYTNNIYRAGCFTLPGAIKKCGGERELISLEDLRGVDSFYIHTDNLRKLGQMVGTYEVPVYKEKSHGNPSDIQNKDCEI